MYEAACARTSASVRVAISGHKCRVCYLAHRRQKEVTRITNVYFSLSNQHGQLPLCRQMWGSTKNDRCGATGKHCRSHSRNSQMLPDLSFPKRAADKRVTMVRVAISGLRVCYLAHRRAKGGDTALQTYNSGRASNTANSPFVGECGTVPRKIGVGQRENIVAATAETLKCCLICHSQKGLQISMSPNTAALQCSCQTIIWLVPPITW
jgi:hypothetical protein